MAAKNCNNLHLISNHFNNSLSFILVGDFNVHFEKTDSNDHILLSNLMASYGLSQLVSGPTHKRGHTLDLVFLNSFEVQTSLTPPLDFKETIQTIHVNE